MSDYSVGMKVEARLNGGTAFSPGLVQRVNADGSISIKYDSGEQEMAVKPAMVKPFGAASPSPNAGR